MGSYRFIFAFATSLLIQSVTIGAVSAFGGGAAGWRTVAILYAVIGLAVNTISVLSVRELPQNELNDSASGEYQNTTEKYGLIAAAKLLISNKFYLMICGVYILQQIYTAMINMGIYYMTYVLKNENLFGVFSWAVNIPLIIALVFTPTLVAKWKGMYKLNLRGYMLGTAGRALVVVAGYIGSVPLMLLFTAVAALGQGPWQGDMNAVIASCSEYTYLTKNKRVDGTMYSCTSLGIKLGGGLGTAVAGWMLAASGFDGAAAVQPESCIRMLCFMYLWVPVIISFIITFVLSKMNVEQTNAELRKKRSGEFLWSDIDTKM
jgi:GPH family glycoside/pentoside/hexuronide:cation symporter